MSVQNWIIVACAIAVVAATLVAVFTVIYPPRRLVVPVAAIAADSDSTVVVDIEPTSGTSATSEIVTVVSPDVARNTNPDEEYTIVPVDSVPLEYEIKHLDLTDRSQGQYVPSWRDSMNMPAMHHSGGKLKPIAKQDAMCDTVSEQEVTHTTEFMEKSETVGQDTLPYTYQMTPSVQNFMTNRL